MADEERPEINRQQVIIDTFLYQERWDLDSLVQVHVPSVSFHDKRELLMWLNRCITDGLLRIDQHGVYTRIEKS